MKQSSILLIAFVTLIAGCMKATNCGDDKDEKGGDSGLIGKWTYTEQFYSIGSPGSWHSVSPANQKIEFKEDGSFISSQGFMPGANHYELVDSAKMKISPANTNSGFILMGYKVSTSGRGLELYPLDPLCIEGCSSRFVR